jgi:MFS family permease
LVWLYLKARNVRRCLGLLFAAPLVVAIGLWTYRAIFPEAFRDENAAIPWLLFVAFLLAAAIGITTVDPFGAEDRLDLGSRWRLRLVHVGILVSTIVFLSLTLLPQLITHGLALLFIRDVLGFAGLAFGTTVLIGGALSWTTPTAITVMSYFAPSATTVVGNRAWLLVAWPLGSGDDRPAWFVAIGLFVAGSGAYVALGERNSAWTLPLVDLRRWRSLLLYIRIRAFAAYALVLLIVAILAWLMTFVGTEALTSAFLTVMLPVLPVAMAVVPMHTPIRLLERSLPSPIWLFDTVYLAFTIMLSGIALSFASMLLGEGIPWPLVTNVIGYAGLILICCSLTEPVLSWMVAVIYGVAVFVPIYQDDRLLQQVPANPWWWPVAPVTGPTFAAELALLVLGVLTFVCRERARLWAAR